MTRSVAAAISTASSASAIPPATSPRAASTSARATRQAIAVLRFWPASSSLAAAIGSASSTRPSATSACASSAAAWPASTPTPISMSPSYASRSGAIAAAGSPAMSSTMPVRYAVSSSPWRRPELLERRAGRVEHRARDVEPAAQRLQHRLAPHRRRLDRRRRGGDAQQPHDVEATPTGAGDRARAEQRGERRRAEDRGDAATVVDPPGRAEREVELQLGVADPTEPGEQSGPHLVGLGLAGAVAELLQHLRGAGRGRLRADETLGIGEADELGLEARRPGAERRVVAGLGAQLLDDGPGADDVARREHALARGDQQLGPRRGVGRRAAARARGGRARRRRRGRRGRARGRPRSTSSSAARRPRPVTWSSTLPSSDR